MTLPPHGPPEITEAQQAATSLGEVADPTPDNVSRALQDYSPYAVASAAASLGASGGGGGGSQPISAVYSGNNVSIANGATELLTWDVLDSEVDVLDISDVERPTVLAEGTYLVSVWVNSFPLTEGGFYQAELVLDTNEGVADIFADSPPDPGLSLGQNVCISAGAFVPAGGELNLRVFSWDGASTRNFTLKNATIVFIPA